ncbi:MAG: hypothetical protein ACPGLY_19280 [Rubripirellula sp.]
MKTLWKLIGITRFESQSRSLAMLLWQSSDNRVENPAAGDDQAFDEGGASDEGWASDADQ